MSWDPNQPQGQPPSGTNPYGQPGQPPSAPNPYQQQYTPPPQSPYGQQQQYVPPQNPYGQPSPTPMPMSAPGKIFGIIQVPAAQTPGKMAFWHGLIFGLLLAGGAFIFLLLETFVGGGFGVLLGILTFLGALAMYFLAGMQTTRVTGTVGMGAIAGLWVGVTYGLINTILAPIITAIAFNANLGGSALNSISGGAAGSFVVGAVILANIGGWILAIGFGAGAGAIGGLVAKNQLQSASGAAAQPYPGQPTNPPSQPGSYS